jgi:archaellum component FlaC
LRIRSNDAAIEAKQAELEANQAGAKALKGAAADQAKTKIDSLKTEVADLKKENTYLRAYTAKAKADYASDGMKNADLARAQNKFDIAKQELQMNKQFAGSQQMMNRWMGIQQLTMTLSQMTNAAGNMIAETRRADATAEGVEQTQHNEQLDQIKDLFQQAETVVQAIVQLMQAVLSAENESLMEAIRA